MRLPKSVAAAAALAAVACFAAAPADARGCRGGNCIKVVHTKKLTVQTAHRSTKTAHRRHAPRHEAHRIVWHGWVGKSFYLDGVRYRGGTRRGPAMAYNNYEGGFHPEAFWVLHLRSVSGI